MQRNRLTENFLAFLLALATTLFVVGCGGEESKPEATSSPEHSATPTQGHGEDKKEGHGPSTDEWSATIKKAAEHAAKGELSEASEQSSKALELARESGQARSLITSLHNCGKLALSQGDTRQGIDHFSEALELERHIEKPDPRLIALCLNKIAAAHYADKDTAKAISTIKSALEVEDIEKDLRAELLHNLASIYRLNGDSKNSAACLEEARRLRASENTELPTEGVSGQWLNRGFSTHSHKRLVQIFQDRHLPPSRIAAFSRYKSREWLALESEEEAEKSSH